MMILFADEAFFASCRCLRAPLWFLAQCLMLKWRDGLIGSQHFLSDAVGLLMICWMAEFQFVQRFLCVCR
jgi:hypothetical protein